MVYYLEEEAVYQVTIGLKTEGADLSLVFHIMIGRSVPIVRNRCRARSLPNCLANHAFPALLGFLLAMVVLRDTRSRSPR